MLILATGSNKSTQAGFSLLEILVVLVIISITLGMISIALPKNDARIWKDMNDRLVSSLNQGKDETTLSGVPILFQIDDKGWRFLAQNLRDEIYILGDALAPYNWQKPTLSEGNLQFYLDESPPKKVVLFKINQGALTATIHRRPDGYFDIE
jgi:general secretion pathway protein H